MKKLTVEIEGKDWSDLELALEQVKGWIEGEFTSGSDRNDTGNYQFSVDEVEDKADFPARPRTFCGCGYELVWVSGEWQHDCAPYLWGDDHDPHPDEPEPTGLAREYWDAEDCVDG